MNEFDTVIISDTHLGATNCNVDKLRIFLNILIHIVQPKVLILNGDIFDDLNFKRLDGAHFHCLRLIRKTTHYNIKTIWISGNHDGTAEVLSHIMGVEVQDETKISLNNKQYFVIHGDLFDSIVKNHPTLTWIADTIYRMIQLVDPSTHFALYLKRKSKTFLRAYDKVKSRAVAFARKKGFHGIIIGHLHIAESSVIEGIHYLNSGSWTQSICSFIGIKGNHIELCDYDTFCDSLEKSGIDLSVCKDWKSKNS